MEGFQSDAHEHSFARLVALEEALFGILEPQLILEVDTLLLKVTNIRGDNKQ
jgi:hypothetical protein